MDVPERGTAAAETTARNLVGLSLAFGTALRAAMGLAVGVLVDRQEMAPFTFTLLGGTIGGALASVPALLTGYLRDFLDFRGHLLPNRLLKAALTGGLIGVLPCLIHLPMVVLVVLAGSLSAWLAALRSAPLPPFPCEQPLPLQRRWAWYFLTGLLLLLAPLLVSALLGLSYGYGS